MQRKLNALMNWAAQHGARHEREWLEARERELALVERVCVLEARMELLEQSQQTGKTEES